jgi:hypothetical protein
MIRTGEQHKDGIHDGREVWIDGDVTQSNFPLSSSVKAGNPVLRDPWGYWMPLLRGA